MVGTGIGRTHIRKHGNKQDYEKSAAKMPRQHPTKEMMAITFQMVIPAVETPPVAVPREEESAATEPLQSKFQALMKKLPPKPH